MVALFPGLSFPLLLLYSKAKGRKEVYDASFFFLPPKWVRTATRGVKGPYLLYVKECGHYYC